MTHVLDEPIEEAEEAVRESFVSRHIYDHWEPGQPRAQKQEARRVLRVMVAVLRALRAERDGTRGCPPMPERGPDEERDAYLTRLDDWRERAEELRAERDGARLDVARDADGRPISSQLERHHMEALGRTPDELRAEGRREERERVVLFVEHKLAEAWAEMDPNKQKLGFTQALSLTRTSIYHGDHWKDGEG